MIQEPADLGSLTCMGSLLFCCAFFCGCWGRLLSTSTGGSLRAGTAMLGCGAGLKTKAEDWNKSAEPDLFLEGDGFCEASLGVSGCSCGFAIAGFCGCGDGFAGMGTAIGLAWPPCFCACCARYAAYCVQKCMSYQLE